MNNDEGKAEQEGRKENKKRESKIEKRDIGRKSLNKEGRVSNDEENTE